ncbi:CLUMA_CG017802, isoform A [Clunio marinus]|uniref:CLUMA_CG017802, isoform A n=1 Tax=Clunio marinus TaxID=568069 RepID=A0A1J1IZZ4_9DIPT|nr:CLUMA_CG017802, isoform A [Clunio marinus]
MENVNKADDNPFVECPAISENSACPCYKFEDGLFLECPGVTSLLLKTNLQHIQSPIQSLSIYDFDRTITTLTSDLFSSSSESGLHIKHLQFSNSNLQTLKENSLVNLKESLESLSIVNGKLGNVPTKALSQLQKLIVLDFEANEIAELYDNSFYGIHLVKLHLKGNAIEDLPEMTFSGLEESLAEIDLSENKLTSFPIVPLIKMENLRIASTCFFSLRELQSLDISHNDIIEVDPLIFEFNKHLRIIDMSHNHIHYISGVFSNLPELEEVLLSENNILELGNNCFSNSSSIKVIYLENNSIQRLDFYVFHSLGNLDQLYLSNNYIKKLPSTIFEYNRKLTSLTLDNNLLKVLDDSVFSNLINLREIRLKDNLIERIDNRLFANSRNLMELYLQNNRIKTIETEAFRQCHRLKYVDIRHNELVDVENIFNTNSSLLSVQLNSNLIKFINHKIFNNQFNVQVLSLENNLIKKLEKALFTNLLHIERLYLKNNSIYQIPDNAFDKMLTLKHLDLSINELMTVNQNLFAKLVRLEELHLSQNLIHSIESNSFEKLKNLKTLDLSENNIHSLHKDLFVDPLPSLYYLNLRRTNLSKIEPSVFKGLTNLNELNLDENFLHSWDIRQIDIPSLRVMRISSNNFSVSAIKENMFDKLPSLQTLIMVDCGITQLPDTLFVRNTNLVRIDLSRNQLRVINRNLFSRLNVFKELNLNKNVINDFPHMALSNISTLEILSLANNAINYIDFFKLNGLPNLRQLDLSENLITSISGFNTAHLPHLDMIDLSGNSLFSLPSNFFQHSISLQRIDLAFNRFMQIPSTALSKNSLARLAWLNLTGNPLEKIYAGGIQDEKYPYLTELHIRQTNLSILTSKDFEMFPALQNLYLTQNHINRISPGAFITLSTLQILDLSQNVIEMLPKERLQGLYQLTKLNVSNNNLRDLEEFSQDLGLLKSIDLSYNQLNIINKETFSYLLSLRELHLTANRLTTIPMDSFRTLRKLELLDIQRNNFDSLPLKALRPLETHLKHLRISGNPIHCSCESQELWEWLHDHLKWKLLDEVTGKSQLNCNQPETLKGKDFLKMEPQDFCDAPLIMKLAIQDIQPYSVLVSWQSREHSGLNGYQVIYHSLEVPDEVRSMYLNRSSNSARLIALASNTLYLICVLGVGNWLTYQNDFNNSDSTSHNLIATITNAQNEVYPEAIKGLLTESMTSRCTQVRTLYALSSIMEMDSLSSNGFFHSLVTRRLGLIVGCCLGIFVFIILIAVLGWLKVKKRRIEQAKRQQMPQEFLSYRSYAVAQEEQSRELNHYNNNAALTHHMTKEHAKDNLSNMSNCQHHHMHNSHGHPNYISGTVMGTTTVPIGQPNPYMPLVMPIGKSNKEDKIFFFISKIN